MRLSILIMKHCRKIETLFKCMSWYLESNAQRISRGRSKPRNASMKVSWRWVSTICVFHISSSTDTCLVLLAVRQYFSPLLRDPCTPCWANRLFWCPGMKCEKMFCALLMKLNKCESPCFLYSKYVYLTYQGKWRKKSPFASNFLRHMKQYYRMGIFWGVCSHNPKNIIQKLTKQLESKPWLTAFYRY